MLESDLRDLFGRQAADDPPAAHISIQAACRIGRGRLRKRRAATMGTPLLAAGAVVAVAVSGALTGAQPHSRAMHVNQPAAHDSTVPTHFDPQDAYASFGWLPPGVLADGGSTARDEVTLEADSGGAGRAGYEWIGYARGTCRQAGGYLVCGGVPVVRITGSAPTVHGGPAYWGIGGQVPGASVKAGVTTTHVLAHSWAGGGWAILNGTPNGLLRIARNIRLDLPTRIRYPVQLTGVPASWRMEWSDYDPKPGEPASSNFSVYTGPFSAQSPFMTPFVQLDVEPSSGQSCPAEQDSRYLDGHKIVLYNTYSVGYKGPAATLCSSNVHGSYVNIAENGHVAIGLESLFSQHLTLLGPDVSRWTTQPLN